MAHRAETFSSFVLQMVYDRVHMLHDILTAMNIQRSYNAGKLAS